ncbi:carbohydrate ABC transporter permease [Vallitalea guaymasensis]|uniref:carbohydrate ABC transporter permease n=1 Tax=Vallitalea guaymasensis TaxID=1185412 RepID=UPI0023566AB7|nr:carbohydrate ABC transporter permease [Vallitalea guaymasensis]
MEGKRIHLSKILPCIITIILAIVTIWPFYITVLMAFKTPRETFQSFYGLPKVFRLDNFINAWKITNFSLAFKNSFIVTMVSLVFIVLATSMAGYAIARSNKKFYNFIYVLFVSGMMVPFQVIMIPLYKMGRKFGLVNNRWGIILIYICLGVHLAVFLYTGFVKGIPKELEEAATIDGASTPQIFFKVVFPLLKPITMTILVLDTMWIWNDFFLPLLFLQDTKIRTLPLTQFYFYGKYNTQMNLAFAAFILAMIPILIFYFAMQKYIVKGIVAGAVKG